MAYFPRQEEVDPFNTKSSGDGYEVEIGALEDLRRLKPKVHLSRRDLETCDDCEALRAEIGVLRDHLEQENEMRIRLEERLKVLRELADY